MSRFLSFLYTDYYPDGGWNDFFGQHDTFDDARLRVDEEIERLHPIVGNDWAQIVEVDNSGVRNVWRRDRVGSWELDDEGR